VLGDFGRITLQAAASICLRAFSSMASRSISTSRNCQFSTFFLRPDSLSSETPHIPQSLPPVLWFHTSLATVFTIGGVHRSPRMASDCMARISRSTARPFAIALVDNKNVRNLMIRL